jgi:spore germination protein YaaH
VLKAAAEFNLKREMVVHATDRYGEISAMLADKRAAGELIEAILKEAALYDGVNLNFEEYGLAKGGEDLTPLRQILADFVFLLSERLKAAGKTLTLTLHPPNSVYKGYDYNALGELVDRIIIMAYDYGPRPEPFNLVLQAVEMAAEVVPPHKLLLGISAPYETPESIVPKIGIAKRYNLQGIALWRLGLVTQKIWQVLRDNVL